MVDFGVHVYIISLIHILILNQSSFMNLEDKLRREIQEAGGIETNSTQEIPEQDLKN